MAMEAGPRDPQSATRNAPEQSGEDAPVPVPGQSPGPGHSVPPGLSADGPGQGLTPDGLASDGPEDDPESEPATPEVEVELRPQGRFRIWQIAPIVVLAGVGSLMFAFPLAFGTGDGGSVIAMLGLLLGCCAAGWGMTAARRVGYTWPGLPSKSSGERADWRFVALYVAIAAVVVALAVWRVARLR
ncbi:hypothetical protein [Streptomyces montanisoli]|uniref:hypothetical protein n=1 Tax=Streptomyces montanisoli TaxID=2798581 RepID=UPI003FD8B083